MLEPCIMDIKVGKRTWDPLATADKRTAEESKYLACKQNLGICIPGFQVYNLSTGKCKRYDKDYGKKLNEKTIKNALKIFLNAETELCRELLSYFLSVLWEVQQWARKQKTLKLYSSSLLFVYDARRLRNFLESTKVVQQANGSTRNSTPSPSGLDYTNGLSSQFNYPSEGLSSETIQCFKQIQRLHSTQHNYDKVIKIYTF